MSEPAQTVGERLKAAREAAGMTAQQAADTLRLDAWVIEALESGDYARIGPSVYGKGHMKRYAALLELPAEEMVAAAYARGADPAAAPTPAERQARAPARALRMRASAAPRSSWVGLAVLIIIALGVAGPYLRRPWNASATPPGAAIPAHVEPDRFSPATAVPTAAASAPAGIDEVPPAVADPGASPVDHAAIAGPSPSAALPGAMAAVASATAPGDRDAVTGVGRARLRLRFSADSWVYVRDAAGRRLFAGNGRANSVTTIAGDAPMKVYLGYASGVQLEVNNRVVAIGPQFVAGDVARFEAGADGVLRRDAHPVTASNPHPRG